jgi:hypothetical protein
MTCVDDDLSNGAPYQICVNRHLWNGDLPILVPGYTNPAASPSTPSGDLGGVSAAEIITTFGYAWAALDSARLACSFRTPGSPRICSPS